MKIAINKKNLIYGSFIVFIFFMPFGYKLQGRMAISNIGQIISFLIILPVIIKRLHRDYLKFNILSSVLMIFAAAVTALRYDISMHFGHLGFFILIGFYISFLVYETRSNPTEMFPIINNSIKITGCVFVLPFMLVGIRDILILRRVYSSYIFDDKSHAVLFFVFYAFAELKYLKGKTKYIISVIYFVLALTTTSRLGIIFIPFYLVCFYMEFMREGKTKVKKLSMFLIVISVLAIGVYFVYRNIHYFSVFSRINTSSGSTKAHIVLIIYAVKIKFANMFNFLFGTGPGSFSNVLVASGMDLSDLIKVDRASYEYIIKGLLPVHSTHFELLLDFSAWIFVVYVRFLFSIFIKLLQKFQKNDLLFFIAFMGAELFYSTFHEMLFYVILIYIFVSSEDIDTMP